MKGSRFNSLKVKISLLFSLLIAIAFGLNWQVAAETIRGEKIEDLEKVLRHILVESADEYISAPLLPSSDLAFLHMIPHNRMILKDSEASHIRFVVDAAPYRPGPNEVSASIRLENRFYLSAISDQEKIDAAVGKYARKLLNRYLWSLLAILVVSFLLLRQMMSPLGILAERARTWKRGDPFRFAPDNTGNEIDELARAFAALVYRLEGFRTKEKLLFKEMAHELKTPIALMRARLDVYENSDTYAKEKFVAELSHDIERLIAELKNVLFFESSDFEESVEIEVTDVLNEVIAKVDILARQRRLGIEVSEGSFTLCVPRIPFQKLLMALIENALTYARENTTITIAVDSEGRRIAIANEKGDQKYLFSSKIGQKMLDRIGSELGIGYQIRDDETSYRIELFVLEANASCPLGEYR